MILSRVAGTPGYPPFHRVRGFVQDAVENRPPPSTRRRGFFQLPFRTELLRMKTGRCGRRDLFPALAPERSQPPFPSPFRDWSGRDPYFPMWVAAMWERIERSGVGCGASLARPKSRIFSWPRWVYEYIPWLDVTMDDPLVWAASRASPIWMRKSRNSLGSHGLRCFGCPRVSP